MMRACATQHGDHAELARFVVLDEVRNRDGKGVDEAGKAHHELDGGALRLGQADEKTEAERERAQE